MQRNRERVVNRKTRWSTLTSHATLVGYTASIMLSAAQPVLAAGIEDGLRSAPPVNELPLEPDTQFDAVRWYDRWWSNSVSGLARIPGNFVDDLDDTYSALKSVFTDGVKVGNVLIVRGAPDTWKRFSRHMELMGVHYVDTVRMLPEHAVNIGGHFKDAGKSIGRAAKKNAIHTADVVVDQSKEIKEDWVSTANVMGDIGQWMKRRYKNILQDSVSDIRSDATWTKNSARDSIEWTRDEIADTASDTARWMNDYGHGNGDLTQELARWTARQVPDGWNDTIDWTKGAATETADWTGRAARWTAESTANAVKSAQVTIEDTHDLTEVVTDLTADASTWATEKTQEAFERAITNTADATLGKVSDQITNQAAASKRTAKWLWKRGYKEGLKGGFELARDNYFAGDIEGVAVGTFYSLAAVAEGIGYVLVLEPLAFTGHVGLGVTKTVGLAAAGTAGTATVAAAGVAATTGVAVTTGTLTAGVAVLGTSVTALTAAAEGGKIVATAAAGAFGTAGAAVTGGAYTAGAATAGFVRTVGGMTVGGLATAAVAGPGLLVGETALAVAGTGRLVGTALAGTALTAGALTAGGFKITGDAVWGTAKMVGVTATGAAGEVMIPAISTGVSVGRIAYMAGTAVVDNAVITPAVATWDILTALTLGGWELVKDPVKGTFHLVAGATGFTYRLAGLTTSLAVTATAGVLFAVAKAPLSLVYYGGMWSIAAGGKLLDKVIAPLRFDTQRQWKRERLPQLHDLLMRQEPSVLREIGQKVTYIRVVFSGVDRGKVNFFTTENNGRTFKFRRKVRSNCRVVYTSGSTSSVLDSGLYDRACLGGRK